MACHTTIPFVIFACIVFVGFPHAGADVLVLEKVNMSTVVTIPDEDVKLYEDRSTFGRIQYVDPHHACNNNVQPPPFPIDIAWIALVGPGNCSNKEKLLSVQNAGFDASILYGFLVDNSSSVPQEDLAFYDEHIKIVAVEVSYDNGTELACRYTYHNEDVLIKIEGLPSSVIRLVAVIVCVIVACVILPSIPVCVFIKRRYCRESGWGPPQSSGEWGSLASLDVIMRIPERRFRNGEYHDICSICMEEFRRREIVRVLPCEHIYHSNCITVWLTEGRRTCPLCNQVVNISGTQGASESSPLLGWMTFGPAAMLQPNRPPTDWPVATPETASNRQMLSGEYYDVCPICMEEFRRRDIVRVLPCEHICHSSCITVWLTEGRRTCPLCNQVINISGTQGTSESSPLLIRTVGPAVMLQPIRPPTHRPVAAPETAFNRQMLSGTGRYSTVSAALIDQDQQAFRSAQEGVVMLNLLLGVGRCTWRSGSQAVVSYQDQKNKELIPPCPPLFPLLPPVMTCIHVKRGDHWFTAAPDYIMKMSNQLNGLTEDRMVRHFISSQGWAATMLEIIPK